MLALVWIPGILVILSAVLAVSVSLERHVLSPRAVVLRVVRAKRATPEHAEALVAAQLAPFITRTRTRAL